MRCQERGERVAPFGVDSGFAPGERVSFVFEEEAVYHVWCRLHGELGRGMHTNVTVEE